LLHGLGTPQLQRKAKKELEPRLAFDDAAAEEAEDAKGGE